MSLTLEANDVLEKYYPDQGAHGRKHAVEVAELATVLAQQPEYAGIFSDVHGRGLELAAYFHDSGYPQVDARFASGLNWEHTVHSSVKALEYLIENQEALGLPPQVSAMVVWAILNHDNTNYTYPHYPRNERARAGRLMKPQTFEPHMDPGVMLPLDEKASQALSFEPNTVWMYTTLCRSILQLLQEADGLKSEAKRTLDFSLSRKLPLVTDDLPYVWQASVESNVLLAVTRAIRDAYTRFGQERARVVYEEGIGLLEEVVKQHSVEDVFEKWYAEEYRHSFLRPEDLEVIWSQNPIQRWIYNPSVLENPADFSEKDFKEIDMSFYYPKYSIVSMKPVSREDTLLVEREYTGEVSTHIFPKPRMIPIDSLQDYEGRISDHMDNVRTSEYMIPSIRNGILRSYGLDILTQLKSSVTVHVSGCHPVWGSYSGDIEVAPPWVVQLPRSDRYVVIKGKSMVEAAHDVGRTHLRVLDFGVKRV